ncbi:nucleotide exchange factor GrpE [Gillisia sp. CAL575]|uniref:nucleotide exchange factor GrpE n=1 Tax=Gillisia sp. CAL575 TaxID=985255 RepID=UPI00039F0B9B|nr:nucleotide exchange factor GrpE [Gillisia sp. CAL575]
MDKHKDTNNTEENNKDSVKDHIEELLDDAIEEVEAGADGEQLSENDQLKADLEKEKDKFLRLFAEFENFKRRTSKERIELFKTANQEVMSAMLPVLDDFDRAMNEIKKAKDKNLLKGVELIYNKFNETLLNKGLEPMNVKQGDVFDADMHEAITQIPAPSDKLKGKIVDVVERGYMLGEKIIRYPKVVTGK